MRNKTGNSKLKTQNSKPPTIAQQQQALRCEFCDDYGLKPQQISFEGQSVEPIFDFDALSLLVNALTDIPAIKVGLAKFDDVLKLSESSCYVKLPNGRTREYSGFARIGERLHDGSIIGDDILCINVSRARALRVGVRAVGFDPVKFHNARKEGRTLELCPQTDQEEWDKYRAQVHTIAGHHSLNFIKKDGDRTEYENLMASFFKGVTTSKELNREERGQWLGMLRAWQRGAEIKAA
jgi:hypothetical protein